MSSALKGKRILLGITGSIAAYKAAMLTRLFIKAEAEVQVLMTAAAADFIAPLTLSTLSKRPVYSEVSSESGWHNHVELGLWADAMVIAPATANTLAKMAHGMCDNILTACYLSARCPVFFAPAMDLDMWRHPATQANVRQLEQFGHRLIPPASGELASGLHGEGRMAEPESILEFLEKSLQAANQDLSGINLLITAGPTFEAIDPVRFIGNRSSGKMGVAIANAAAARGADVTLILGPSQERPDSRVRLIRVESALEMHAEALKRWPDSQAAILSAAVADYRPAEAATEKIKKSRDSFSIQLVKNPDIAADLGKQKVNGQMLVGFALETHDAEAQAKQKLERKNFDFIVLNTLTDPGAGFHHDTNKITIFFRDNKRLDFQLKSKQEVAADILDALASILARG
ncbi:MAG: bifunctional phosphopantothenoylcysteine decarboxylase/phosphopantothenate--cysteine ligase CoaBC [Haliscomenobacter sp.]|nr:bifunctional phosphopantothenoylcysteine decarboxylase/phosphopantothenate--cysteine ligase CoaBC [Haliscomenobacter sp.]MBK8878369.1 bifunctional phosphopantothenoylcysteine decarboxylase/phosphopantothenate--cysteine ligase CoaBC [Haliscomenobacter sp.]